MSFTIDINGILEDLKRWKKYYISSLIAKGVKSDTIKLYSYNIDSFTNYLFDNYEDIKLSQINKQIINMWLNFLLIDENMKNSTVNTKFTIIKSFFLYITEENEDLIDFTKIFNKIKIKTEYKEKVGYKEEDLLKILEILERMKNLDNKKELDPNYKSLLFKIVYFTGIRVSELLSLKFEDIEIITNDNHRFYRIKVFGKGSKERFVYINADEIEDELEHINKKVGLLCTKSSGKAYVRKEMYSLFKSLFVKAGVKYKGLHELRHTFARKLVSNNVNLKTIQELLGHSDIQTTAKVYAKTNEANKIDALIALK